MSDSLNKGKDYAKMDETISRLCSGNKSPQLQVFLKGLLIWWIYRPMFKNYTYLLKKCYNYFNLQNLYRYVLILNMYKNHTLCRPVERLYFFILLYKVALDMPRDLDALDRLNFIS